MSNKKVAFQDLIPYLEKNMAFHTAINIIDWDANTLAPEEASEYTAKAMGILSQEQFTSLINPKVKEIMEGLKEEELSQTEKAILRRLKKEYQKSEAVPANEMREFTELAARATNVWQKAKKEQNFSLYAPYLEKIVEYKKKFAGYSKKEGGSLYNVLLDGYEESFHVEELDRFFSKLKEEIIPLLKKVEQAEEIDDSFFYQEYDIEKQKEFNVFLAEYMGFNFKRGVIAESEHPFTTSWHNHDVRITTHYYKDNLSSAILSTIHEGGHALYEQGIRDEFTQTLVGDGASCAMHESQSRFYENVLGRSEAFWEPLYPKLQDTFPKQLGQVSLGQFVRALNKVKADFIRTEADELTYCLHIMVRYELEKQMIEEDVPVDKLPGLWNQKYQEYLGITPNNDKEGILQDVHWSMGDMGYFPSYALGNAFAAQIYHTMKKELPVEELLRKGKIAEITAYLREHIHQYGASKEPREMLKALTGEEFNPDYYIQYLKEKFEQVYQL
ncbi:MAG: carboxypeptidase M32 [Lachnospiraceae bacterium]|nr:carboxypeptidase M32 [Lachnospiraceae bacterium]